MMKIDKVEPSARVKGRILVYFEDGTLLKATEKEVLDFSLYAGREICEEERCALEKAAASSRTKNKAVAMIGARALSKKELENRLLQKGEDAQDAAQAVQWLEEIGALDDRSYASSIVRHYGVMGYGPAKIRDELYRRGIPREMWEEALAQVPDPAETIERYIASKLRGKVADEKQIKRISDGLRRRGFRWEDIREAICRIDQSLPEEWE